MTVHTLAYSGGSNCYIRDVARHMVNKGHNIAVYSPEPGPMTDELTNIGCLVSDKPDLGDFKPDVIHGQHHLDLMPVALRYFSVPIVYFTHGVLPPQENPPPSLARVVKHVCISELCKAELLRKREVPPSDLAVLPNFVDESVFPFMATMSNRSRKPIETYYRSKLRNLFRNNSQEKKNASFRCLVFGNAKPKEINALREACIDLGVALDEIGQWSQTGNKPQPEEYLPRYDLVFCYGRSAMESLYCGCDVILMFSTGTGDIVTDSNFNELRQRNFGYTTCQKSFGREGLSKMIFEVLKTRTSGKLLLSKERRLSLRSAPILERLEEIYFESIGSWERRRDELNPEDMIAADNRALSSYFLELRNTMRFY